MRINIVAVASAVMIGMAALVGPATAAPVPATSLSDTVADAGVTRVQYGYGYNREMRHRRGMMRHDRLRMIHRRHMMRNDRLHRVHREHMMRRGMYRGY